MAKLRTDLSRARGTGATGTGTEHFWQQRLTGLANVGLVGAFVILLVYLHDKDFVAVQAAFRNPLVGVVMALTILSATVHMRLGMQVIVEDYVHGAGRLPLQILSTFFAVLVAAASLFAILKLSLGA